MGGKAAFAGLAISLVLGTFSQARAETFVEHNAEFRMQLDFVVPDAALRKFLPSGWEPNIATQGPAKDCNLRMIFIDRVDITGADGAPAGSSRLVYLAIPVKQSGSTTVGQMIIAGLTSDPKDAPGPFGNYELATTNRMDRSVTVAGKDTLVKEDWEFVAASGELSNSQFARFLGEALSLAARHSASGAALPRRTSTFGGSRNSSSAIAIEPKPAG